MSTLELAAIEFVRTRLALREAKRERGQYVCTEKDEGDPSIGYFGVSVCWHETQPVEEMCENCQKQVVAHQIVKIRAKEAARALRRLKRLVATTPATTTTAAIGTGRKVEGRVA